MNNWQLFFPFCRFSFDSGDYFLCHAEAFEFDTGTTYSFHDVLPHSKQWGQPIMI
jgi:hypothetical protein